MSNNLISLTKKRISTMEKELEKERNKLDNLIKATKRKGLEPMRFEIENTSNGWNLIYPSGIENSNLPSLKVCLLIIKPFYRKCQFRSQSFELYDRNTKATFRDYRVFTDYVELSKKEKEKRKEDKRDPKSITKKMMKKIENNRLPRNGKVQSKVKKIDVRIFDRTY